MNAGLRPCRRDLDGFDNIGVTSLSDIAGADITLFGGEARRSLPVRLFQK
ncbi:hypothetical protein QUF72_21590 [Desulfobacterales bacterium HSG2]|nr:hypothetical protein [Desulfobacterales bacterium HSG2]